jgi:hypothetical protein
LRYRWLGVALQRNTRIEQRTADGDADVDRLARWQPHLVGTGDLQRRVELADVVERRRAALDGEPLGQEPVFAPLAEQDAVESQ